MQTQASEPERLCRVRHGGFPAVGQPQGLTLEGRDSQATCPGPSGLTQSLFRGASVELENGQVGWPGRG